MPGARQTTRPARSPWYLIAGLTAAALVLDQLIVTVG
jgi:hypothetical protein